MGKPILCLDFDGVCHSYTSGWQGATTCGDPPVPGLFEFLEEVADSFEVHVFSSRSQEPGAVDAMRNWFFWRWREWHHAKGCEGGCTGPEPPELFFPTCKPQAQITLDDRALTFTGEWPSVETLQAFKPWYKRTQRSSDADG